MDNNQKRGQEVPLYDSDWVAKQNNLINARIKKSSSQNKKPVAPSPRKPTVAQMKTPAVSPKGGRGGVVNKRRTSSDNAVKTAEENDNHRKRRTRSSTVESEEELSDGKVAKFVDYLMGIEFSSTLSTYFLTNLINFTPAQRSFDVFSKNSGKNRNADVFCLDQTRVKIVDPSSSNDYIHANILRFQKISRSYIVTQHPLQNTMSDFWMMVFNEKVETIVSLSNAPPSSEFPQFFPGKEQTYNNFGDLFVYCKKVYTPKYKYGRHEYNFDLITSEKTRVVRLYHYPHWPKTMCPQSPQVVNRIVDALSRRPSRGPIVIQCETGVNQSAELLMVDVLCTLLATGEETNFESVFRQMRSQRVSMMTQRIHFLHSIVCVLEFIKKKWKQEKPSLMVCNIDTLIKSINKNFVACLASEPDGMKSPTIEDK